MNPDENQRIVVLEARVADTEKVIALLVQTSVAEGIKQAVANPETWDAFFTALAKQAQDQAGQVAVGGLRWLFTRLLWFTIGGMLIYMVGGWDLLVRFLTKH